MPLGVGSVVMGSSPLTRGKPNLEYSARRRRGLIPAHAGKTYHLSQRSQEPWAHPRSRGENKVKDWPLTAFVGSSPLTRGKLSPLARGALSVGLIPAHAGKTT